MKFLFACGGTAGHVNPAIAIADELKKAIPGSEFLFVGAGREIENRIIPQAGYEVKNITISGFSRSLSLDGLKKNLKMVKNLSVAGKESAEIINSFKPDAVIGTGGYVCYPVLKTARKKGIPTVMHESNAVPGLTAKMLSGIVDKMLVAFPDTEKQYKKPENVVYTGTPIRGSFSELSKEEAKEKLGISNKKLVVSFWGSLGASKMNAMMDDFISLNSNEGSFFHIHATGGGDSGKEKMVGRLEDKNVAVKNTDIRPYIDDMGTVMTAADVILCRSGASTLAEISALGRPSVLVPSPYVTNNHQEKNARAVEREGGAIVLCEEECTGKKLYEAVISILSDESKAIKMAKCSEKLGVKDATEKIRNIIVDLIH